MSACAIEGECFSKDLLAKVKHECYFEDVTFSGIQNNSEQ